jgi:alkylhydroperoxidase family enzyme
MNEVEKLERKSNEQMRKQTAVEWVLQKILIENGIVNSDIEQAYKMEKEQIIEAVNFGNAFNGWALKHEAEQYYNETYKNEDK